MWRNGRRNGLKIRLSENSVWVRVPPSALAEKQVLRELAQADAEGISGVGLFGDAVHVRNDGRHPEAMQKSTKGTQRSLNALRCEFPHEPSGVGS